MYTLNYFVFVSSIVKRLKIGIVISYFQLYYSDKLLIFVIFRGINIVSKC